MFSYSKPKISQNIANLTGF